MKINNINKFILIISSIIFTSGNAFAQYNVSGLVEFSYREYATKVGGQRSSDSNWSQNYNAILNTDLFDPRILRLNAGVGYSVFNSKTSQDNRTLNYNLRLAFFPGMKISWDLFGSKTTSAYQNTSNIAAYDVTTTSYGGGLRLNLSRPGSNGSNNNNNSNQWRGGFPLPDFSISWSRAEVEAPSALAPLKEERDATYATITYLPGSRVRLFLAGSVENYKNLVEGSSYDINSVNLNSTVNLSSDADLSVNGRRMERDTANLVGYDTRTIDTNADVNLNFREKNRFSHYYRYQYQSEQYEGTGDREYIKHQGNAQWSYRILDPLALRAGLNYGNAEYKTVTETITETFGGASAGASYSKIHTPDFLGPFGINTGYDFNSGFSEVSSTNQTTLTEGRGWNYGNVLTLGLRSIAWKDDSASLDYNFSNRRDHSPLNNDTEQQSFNLNLSTKRVPRTSIMANAAYTVQSTSTSIAAVNLISVQNTKTERRSLTYNTIANYTATEHLRLSAGANRGQSTTSQTYTLSSLPASTTKADDLLLFVAANLGYAVTRNLNFTAEAREEYRSTSTVDSQAHVVTMGMNYRIRSIYLSLESRWREDIPDGGTKTTQTYYIAKLSRPF